MWAVQYHRHGGPEVLVLDEVATPTLRPGQALVRTRASGVSRIDAEMRRGWFPHGLRFPKQAGFDAVGVVVDPGESGLERGIGVAVVLGLEPLRTRGTTVELLAIEPERCGTFPAGHEPTLEDGAAVLGGLTALRAVRDGIRPRPGDRVLVVGAGGPVGLAAIRIAALHGAKVDAVAGAAALAMCAALGATEVFDHRDDLREISGSGRYDGVIVAAGAPADWCCSARPGARVALTDASTWPGSLLAARRAGVRTNAVAAGHDADDLTWLAHRIASGDVLGIVGRRYAPVDLARAHRELGQGGTCGARMIDHASPA